MTASWFDRIVLGASQACFVVARLAIAAMALLVTLDVILRMGWRAPIPGAYELVGMFGALAVAGALPHIQRTGSAIVIGFLVEMLSPVAQRRIGKVTLLIEAAFFAVLTHQFRIATQGAYVSGQVSDILNWPLWWVYALSTMGFGVVTLVALWQLAGRQAVVAERPS